jgi:putative multicomponent Na+:H+ antiporter subunit B
MNPLTSFNLDNGYIYALSSLLPIAAMMVVGQANPYHALVMRGILGAVAAMVYSLFGAPDVALTEALMGTMLAITLYAIAVRSSLVMRLGILAQTQEQQPEFEQLLADLRASLGKHYLRLELVAYPDLLSLRQALVDKEVHATSTRRELVESPLYHTTIRLQRLFDILQADLTQSSTSVTYLPEA